MEEKLARYRETRKDNSKPKTTWIQSYVNNYFVSNNDKTAESEKVQSGEIEHSMESVPDEEDESKVKTLKNVSLILKIILWILLFVLFVTFEFGAVYFAVSMLYLLYKNTRNRPRMPGEISAYSVFNENFETIPGTFSAEKFEQQILHRPKT